MTETQRRIRAYKKALPELRERVIAVALLLAMSASMLASASFAWITLSTAPEVSGMATTVAANGNLEIALAQGESMKNGVPVAAKEPNETAIGDSSVIQGIVNSNITWGNLVNLSEPEYGVNKIELRPALLNNTNRNKYPLHGATYGTDGRVEDTSQRYEYTSYQIIDEALGIKDFAAGDKAKYGVRAISTVTYDEQVGNAIMEEFALSVSNAYSNTDGNLAFEYQRMVNPNHSKKHVLTSGRTVFQALEGLVAVFAQNKIYVIGDGMLAPSSGVPADKQESCSQYVYDFYEMLQLMRDVLLKEAEGLRRLANWQVYASTPEGVEAEREAFKTVEDLIGDINEAPATTLQKLKAKGVKTEYFTTFVEFKTDYKKIVDGIRNLENNATIVSAGGIERFKNANDPNLPKVIFSDISTQVYDLANINTTSINGIELGKVSGSNATSIINGGPVIIKEGALKRFEQRAIYSDECRVNARANVKVRYILGNKTVSGDVTTSADGEGLYLKDLNAWTEASGGITVGVGEAIAQDTYGMAIDLWVRTNYPDAVLTLEGNVLTREVHAQDTNGNYLYTLRTEELVYELYSENQNSGPYYFVNDGTEVPQEALDAGTLSIVKEEQIIGYEGENRIWSDDVITNMGQNAYLADDSTSQGSGSCFVFYAENKSEQQKLLEMLGYFTIVFIDAEGERLATAKLSPEKRFEDQGKITVPMEIVSGVDYEQTLDNGEVATMHGIMRLVPNQPTRITAIVYLDGSELQNQNVLSAGALTGQMNVQFGTNTVLMPPADEKLQQEYRTITVSAQSEDGQSWPDAAKISYEEYDPDGHRITVRLNVDGVQPDRIEGFFVRVISSTQGSRLDTVTFSPVEGEESVWTADFSLKAPGTYILSDLLVDGMQYQLDKDSGTKNHLTVEIPGLSLGPVTLNTNDSVIRTAESSHSIQVTAQIFADVAEPQNVYVYFFEKGNESNQVAARLSNLGNSVWQGDAVFRRSGTYIMDTVTVDGTPLEITDKREITFYLGMRCEVYNAREDNADTFTYEGVPIQVPVTAKIWDDSNNEIQGLSGVKLRYRMGSSELYGHTVDMEWNSGGYYTGILTLISPETYTFEYLRMEFGNSTGTISRADVAPTIRLNPKDPPAYVLDSAIAAYETQLAIDANNPATISVRVENAVNTTIWAEMTKGVARSADTYYVRGNHITGTDTFTFNLNDLSDGPWTLTNLYAQGFLHADGTNYEVTDPNDGGELGFLLADYTNQATKVQTRIIKDIQVRTKLDETNGAYNGSFMQEHKPKLTVSVVNSDGNAVEGVGIAGGTWNVTHTAGTQEAYGGYSESYGSGIYEIPVGTDGVAQLTDLRTAGTYTSNVALTLSVGGRNVVYNIPIGPNFTVNSELPTLNISVSNDVSSNNISGNTATVGFREGSHTNCGTTYKDYYQSTVTLELGKCGAANSGKMTFTASNQGTVHLYTASENSNSRTTSYDWTGNGTCTRYVGLVANANKSNGTKTAAGTLNADTLVLTYGTNTFSFTVKKLSNGAYNYVTIVNN